MTHRQPAGRRAASSPDQLIIGGVQRGRPRTGATFDVLDPRRRAGPRRGRQRHRSTTRWPASMPPPRPPRRGRGARRATVGDLAADLPVDGRSGRRAGAVDHAPRTARRSPTPRGECSTPPSSSAGTPRRPSGSGRDPPLPAARTGSSSCTSPSGCACWSRPWNFPAAMATRKIAPGAGRRLHRDPQAGQRDAARRRWPRRAPARGRRSGRGRQRAARPSSPARSCRAMLADPRVRKLSFTGSTEVGRTLLSQAGEHIVNCSMELGGNAPFIVLRRRRPRAAIEGAMIAKMRNGGEACTAANRFYVERARRRGLRRPAGRRAMGALGWARARGGNAGPAGRPATRTRSPTWSTRPSRPARKAQLAATCRKDPASTTRPPCSPACAPDAQILRSEIFGRWRRSSTFATEDEAVALANDTEYGLVSYVYTARPRPGAAGRRADRGRDGGAQPRTGVRPGRAVRRRQGERPRPRRRHEGLLDFTETKYIAVDW